MRPNLILCEFQAFINQPFQKNHTKNLPKYTHKEKILAIVSCQHKNLRDKARGENGFDFPQDQEISRLTVATLASS